MSEPRNKTRWIEVEEVPPVVHLAMDILKLEPPDMYGTLRVGAQRVVDEYLASIPYNHSADDDAATCQQCEDWDEVLSAGKCKRSTRGGLIAPKAHACYMYRVKWTASDPKPKA